MAPSIQITLFTILLSLAIWYFTSTTQARPLLVDMSQTESSSSSSSSTLVTRLNLDDNSTSCWDSLLKLQSCSGEVIQFFYNGETYLGPQCCRAVHVIVHDCWPTMLTSLGFTSQEGDILRGYCDAKETTPSGPSPTTPCPPDPVGPTKAA